MQVVLNALRVLEEIARRQPVGVSDLHRALGLPKTSVHRALATLAEGGWIRSAGGERTRWALAARAVVLGRHVAEDVGLRSLALPVMEALREETGETVHLMLREDRHVVLIERLDGHHAVRAVNPLGTRAPLHASANGKAILAAVAASERGAYRAGGLAATTERTITDPAALEREIERVQTLGYATNRGEFLPEVAAVAAAIRDGRGRALAALSLSLPRHRLDPTRERRFGRLVVAAARELSDSLGWAPDAEPAAARA